jgi:hypothetical protein
LKGYTRGVLPWIVDAYLVGLDRHHGTYTDAERSIYSFGLYRISSHYSRRFRLTDRHGASSDVQTISNLISLVVTASREIVWRSEYEHLHAFAWTSINNAISGCRYDRQPSKYALSQRQQLQCICGSSILPAEYQIIFVRHWHLYLARVGQVIGASHRRCTVNVECLTPILTISISRSWQFSASMPEAARISIIHASLTPKQ